MKKHDNAVDGTFYDAIKAWLLNMALYRSQILGMHNYIDG